MDVTGHTHIILDHRSPNFLWLVAGIALTLSVGAWLLFDQTPVAWVLIVIAFAAGVAASTFQAAAQIGAVYFDQDSEDVARRTFSPRGALRSEERRVGKECVSTSSSGWSPCHHKRTELNRAHTPYNTTR